MKELQQILKKASELEPGEKAVLATVVDVRGSSYRLPGAKMLILENGATFGTVSGGCLEADVLERAKKVWLTNEPQIFTYDTTAAEDSVFSLNMGCRGVIRILLEPVGGNQLLDFLKNCSEHRKKGVSATLISTQNGQKLGSRLLLDEKGSQPDGFGEAALKTVLAEAEKALAAERSDLQTYDFGEVFYEYVAPTIGLVIFGAGADAVPLAEIAENLGWNISVVDHRPAFVTRERFPQVARLILNNTENLPGEIAFDHNTAAVMMTHNYERDRAILANLLDSDVFYLGALGPKKRTEGLLEELRAAGENFDGLQLEKIHAPVGLDLGADTPESIALSIVGEIQAVLKNREGGFLRNRKGSIYGRS